MPTGPKIPADDPALEAQDYAGNPNGNVTPRRVGDLCRNSVTGTVYVSEGTANTDWVPLGP